MFIYQIEVFFIFSLLNSTLYFLFILFSSWVISKFRSGGIQSETHFSIERFHWISWSLYWSAIDLSQICILHIWSDLPSISNILISLRLTPLRSQCQRSVTVPLVGSEQVRSSWQHDFLFVWYAPFTAWGGWALWCIPMWLGLRYFTGMGHSYTLENKIISDLKKESRFPLLNP